MIATGIGSMPGGDPLASEADNAREYAETVRLVLDLLPDLPHLPELPGRGAAAGMTGRACAVVDGLGFDLQPAGWRLTDAAGIDHRRARSLLQRDLDVIEELTQGWTGPFKIQVTGPWTLAATVEKPRGDRVLSDHGARRELSEALAEGLSAHVADVRRRLPGVTELLVQLDEPALPGVLAGAVPTASGFGRHRVVHPPEASEALARATSAVSAAGGVPVVHGCALGMPLGLLRGAGALGVAVDVDVLETASYDDLAATVDDGEWALLGAAPTALPDGADDAWVLRRLERLLDVLGVEPTPRTVVTPACGLASATPQAARRTLELVAETARRVG